MPLDTGSAIGYTVVAPNALDDIRDFYKRQQESQNQLGNEMKLLQAKEADSEFNEYMKVMQFNPEGIDPLLLDKAHDAYSKSIGDAVTSFNNGSTLGDKTVGMASAFSEYEKSMSQYQNISKQWAQLRTTPREDLPASARPIQDILNQPIPNKDKIDLITSYTRIPKPGEIPNDHHQVYLDDGKGNPVPQVSFDPNSLTIGVNIPPKVDYLSPDKGVAIKAAKEANLWVATKDKNGDRLSFIPETQEDAQRYAEQMVGKDPKKVADFLKGKETSESIYNQVIAQNGGEQKAVSSWAAYQDPSAYPQMYDSNGKIIPDVARSIFKQNVMNGIDNATKKRESAPPQNRTNIYNSPLTEKQEFGTPQDTPETLYDAAGAEKGPSTLFYSTNETFGQKSLGTVTGLSTSNGSKVTLKTPTVGTAHDPGIIKVNENGERVTDDQPGIFVPVAKYTTTVKDTKGTKPPSTQGVGLIIDTTEAQTNGKIAGAPKGESVTGTDVDVSLYLPLKELYSRDKPGTKSEMLNYSAHIAKFVEEAMTKNKETGVDMSKYKDVWDKYNFDPDAYTTTPIKPKSKISNF